MLNNTLIFVSKVEKKDETITMTETTNESKLQALNTGQAFKSVDSEKAGRIS